MAARRISGSDKVYYYCSRLYHALEVGHCGYRRFVPGAWDNAVWDCVYALLKDDSWIENQLSAMGKQNQDVDKLVKLEHLKIIQSQNKIAKVRDGFEGGLYDINEAKSKVNGYQDMIYKAEQEIKRLVGLTKAQGPRLTLKSLKRSYRGWRRRTLIRLRFPRSVILSVSLESESIHLKT